MLQFSVTLKYTIVESHLNLEFSFATGLFEKNVFVHLSIWVLVTASSNLQPESEVKVRFECLIVIVSAVSLDQGSML